MATVTECFQKVCERHPDAMALISDEGSLTYKDLGHRAAHLANAIDHWFEEALGRRAGSADVIGVSLEKTVNLYVAILAILAVGASYVPLDPSLNERTRAHILESCRCQLVLADRAGTWEMGNAGTLSLVSFENVPSKRSPDGEWASRSGDDDRCYTIFTSGSTGQPKGVPITHRSLMNLVAWAQAEFSVDTCSRLLQYSTVSFDASVLDIFPALLSGAALCIPSDAQRMSSWQLEAFCERHGVNHAFLPPALLGALDAERFGVLRTVLTGGEPCSLAAIESWSQGRRFYNLYGPTECTVLASFKCMGIGTAPMNIGKAIPGARLHVLDETLCPASLGELHIAGVLVAKGYIGDRRLTDQKFIACPQVDEGVLYKTGDFVRREPSGDLHFLGRMDRQVKIRGYRVELEEIEGALMGLGCARAALKVSPSGDLVAYVVSSLDESSRHLLRRLAEVVADHKLPQFLVRLDQIPQTASGKVDYHALPELSGTEEALAPTLPKGELSSGWTSVASLWAEALGVEPLTLHAESNFRDLGGTSIKMVRLLAQLEARFGLRISFADFLNNPTPAFLQAALNEHDLSHSAHHESHRPHRAQHRGHT